MNINLTLIAQLISFAVFVWFTMKFVWPPIVAALEERAREVAARPNAPGALGDDVGPEGHGIAPHPVSDVGRAGQGDDEKDGHRHGGGSADGPGRRRRSGGLPGLARRRRCIDRRLEIQRSQRRRYLERPV